MREPGTRLASPNDIGIGDPPVIHAYELGGRYIVLDVESGAVHQLDRAAFDALKTPPEQHTPEQVEAWVELQALKDEGLLWSGEVPMRMTEELSAKMPLKALCMHVSHDCNLRCKYCFAHTGDFGGERTLMTPEVAERAVDYLLARCGSRKNLEIDFFGGEPLMAMDTVKHTVKYAKKTAPEKNFRFTLTTNGVLLDNGTIDYLNAEMDNLVLSLDGRREVNDNHRQADGDDGGYGTLYDRLVSSYKRVIETRSGDFYVRGTYTNKNTDFAKDVLHLHSLGFRNISIEPAVLPPSHPLALTEEHLPELFSEYEKLAQTMSGGAGFSFFHFNVDLEQGPCVYKRLRGCGAGIEYAAVTPEGDIYPCHQFVGRKDYLMGSVFDGKFSDEISGLFKAMDANSREECRSCYVKYFCGGGCAAANLTAGGDMYTPDKLGCALAKKRLDCAIYLKTTQINE
jgi:uncharacterized protein